MFVGFQLQILIGFSIVSQQFIRHFNAENQKSRHVTIKPDMQCNLASCCHNFERNRR